MLTRRSPKPQGMEAEARHYSFAARLERDEWDLLKKAQEKARGRLGGTPSNALLLVEVLTAYIGEGAR